MLKTPLQIVELLAARERRLICGIMSGTSVDAIDVALVWISGGGEATSFEVRAYSETYFPEEIQQLIFANAEAPTSSVADICILHSALAFLYSDAVRELCGETGIGVESIDLVGMHGQTIHHLPQPVRIGRHEIRSSLQIGSGATLATLLGVPVLNDFRAADLATGGHGAPLVPYVDYLLFRSEIRHRALANIGGIANITWLPSSCHMRDVAAFDAGPGNMIVDALARKLFGREFDEAGAIARSGHVNPNLLAWMRNHEYFRLPPPKTAGRELFGSTFVDNFLEVATELGIGAPEDLIATGSECTVQALADALNHVNPAAEPFELYLCGGGAQNTFFREGLALSLPHAEIKSLAELGMDPRAKEAVSFAILANEWVIGHPANLPNITGARRRAVLGSLSLGCSEDV